MPKLEHRTDAFFSSFVFPSFSFLFLHRFFVSSFFLRSLALTEASREAMDVAVSRALFFAPFFAGTDFTGTDFTGIEFFVGIEERWRDEVRADVGFVRVGCVGEGGLRFIIEKSNFFGDSTVFDRFFSIGI